MYTCICRTYFDPNKVFIHSVSEEKGHLYHIDKWFDFHRWITNCSFRCMAFFFRFIFTSCWFTHDVSYTHANKKYNYYLFYDVYDLHWAFCAFFLRRSVILLFYFYTSCIVDWFHMCSSSHLASMTVTNKAMSIYIYTCLF